MAGKTTGMSRFALTSIFCTLGSTIIVAGACAQAASPAATPGQQNTAQQAAATAISQAVSKELAQSQDGTAPSEPTEYEKKKFRLGVDAGVYLPTQSRLTSIFGKAVYKFGLDLGTREEIFNGRFTPSIGLISAHKDGNDFYLGQLMGSYEVRLGKPQSIGHNLFVEPYASAGLGIAYADYSITDSNNNHFGAKRLLPTGQLQAGLLIGHRLRINLAYDFFESVDSFNFNGFAFTVAYTVLRF